ncbi:MAG: DUF362 domain-containing protein [Coriobacteriales bacterium]|nr:DUF362 domain-containing protein [Coriobacteriales bacterium]
MGTIWQVYGSDAHKMTKRLLDASQAWRLVPAGASVALKPNLVLSVVAQDGAVTHPGVLSGCIEYFSEHGIRDLSIIESSWIGDRTMRAMRRAGYDEVCKRYDVAFFDLKCDKTRSVQTPIGPIAVCARALDAGLLVDLPVLKGHCQTRMTCALKNLKGCIPDHEKRRFHALGLTKPIAALGAALRPGLVVVDSICGDLCFEEGGTPVQTNRMYLCADAVTADAYGRSLMGLATDDVPYIELAERYGAGVASWSPDDVVSLNEPRDAACYASAAGTVASLTRNVHEDRACSACFAALVRALYTTGRRQAQDIYIGQGWQGATLDGLGIGRCCADATSCVTGCPPSATDIAQYLTNI